MVHGDDLEDDFVFDEIVATSGDEDESTEGPDPTSMQTEDAESSTANQNTAERNEKKRKRREKDREKLKEKKKRKLASVKDVVEKSITEQPPSDLQEYLSTMQAKSFSKMSAIELGDMQIPVDAIADTSIWTGPRTLDNLEDFIVKVLPSLRLRLSQRSKASGSPTLLFIAGAALRVADVTRVLKDPKLRGDKGGEVAKLFAKHFKLAEHVTYLKRTKVGSAVGTPGRIGKLLCETDALTVSALSHIILDVSYRDSKKRNIFDIPETRDEVFKTVLGAPKVLQAIKEGKIQLVLF